MLNRTNSIPLHSIYSLPHLTYANHVWTDIYPSDFCIPILSQMHSIENDFYKKGIVYVRKLSLFIVLLSTLFQRKMICCEYIQVPCNS